MRSALVMSTAVLLAIGVLGASPVGAGASQAPANAVRAMATTTRAATTTTLGQTGGVLASCNATPAVPAGVLLGAEAANAPSYIATTNGVLTSFSHVAGAQAGQVRAIVFSNGPADNHKLVVAKSPKQNVTVNTTNTFQVRLPIRAGQRLGLGYTTKQTACVTVGTAGDSTPLAAPFDPDVSNDFVYTGSFVGNYRPNISAVLEPDADNDGYGDVSQDACPQSAQTQVACPAPETTVTKKPKRVRANPRIKVRFTSSIPGSSFECSLDGRKFKPCTSPYKKRLKAGPHRLRVRAVSPVGIPDPKPAKVKVTIT